MSVGVKWETGELLRIYPPTLELAESRNWLPSQQRAQMLTQLSEEAAELAKMVLGFNGWTPPKGKRLERMIELLDKFRFTRTRGDELFEEMETEWWKGAARKRLTAEKEKVKS